MIDWWVWCQCVQCFEDDWSGFPVIYFTPEVDLLASVNDMFDVLSLSTDSDMLNVIAHHRSQSCVFRWEMFEIIYTFDLSSVGDGVEMSSECTPAQAAVFVCIVFRLCFVECTLPCVETVFIKQATTTSTWHYGMWTSGCVWERERAFHLQHTKARCFYCLSQQE